MIVVVILVLLAGSVALAAGPRPGSSRVSRRLTQLGPEGSDLEGSGSEGSGSERAGPAPGRRLRAWRGGPDRAGGPELWRRWCTWLGGLVLARVRPGRGSGGDRSVDRSSGQTPSADSAPARLGAALTLGLAAGVVWPVLALPVGGLVWTAPAWRARRGRRRAERELVEELPDVTELFRLAVGSGASVYQAVEVLAPRVAGVAGQALDQAAAAPGRGQRLADGLERLVGHGDALRPLASALLAAERYGAPLGPALERVSVDARDLRRRQAEESARRLPVLMLFPLVLCILPAAGLLTVVPLVVASWPHLGGSS